MLFVTVLFGIYSFRSSLFPNPIQAEPVWLSLRRGVVEEKVKDSWSRAGEKIGV